MLFFLPAFTAGVFHVYAHPAISEYSQIFFSVAFVRFDLQVKSFFIFFIFFLIYYCVSFAAAVCNCYFLNCVLQIL